MEREQELAAKISLLRESPELLVTLPVEVANGCSGKDFDAFALCFDGDEKVEMIDGLVTIAEVDSLPRDITSRVLHSAISSNVLWSVSERQHIAFTVRTRLQPDGAFYNRHVPHKLQATSKGVVLPCLVVEVGHAQSLQHLQAKASAYLAHPATRMVIVIKLYSRPEDGEVDQMLCVLYHRAGYHARTGTAIAEQVISFGRPFDNPYAFQDILDITGVEFDAFVGVGTDTAVPLVRIPQEVIWADAQSYSGQKQEDCLIDLNGIVNVLKDAKWLVSDS